MKTLKNLKWSDKGSFRLPKNIQDTIPVAIIYEDGIFLHENNKYSKCFTFNDINYSVASLDDKKDMFLAYGELLNALDSGATTKITVSNRKLNKHDFKKNILLPLEDNSLDHYRKEYNDNILSQINKSNGFIQEKYITISINKKNIEEARNYFNRISADLSNYFNKLGSKCSELTVNERLEILHNFYREKDENIFDFNLKEDMKRGQNFKDYICPDSLEHDKDYFKLGDKFGRTLYLKHYATYLKDTFLAELTEINRNLMLSIDIIPVPMEQAIQEVENRRLGVETNITNWQRRQNANNNFSAVIPYDLEQQRNESKEFLDDLTLRDQKMFLAVLTITHMADSKEQLDNDTDSLISTARKHLCQLAILKYQQLDGLNTSLPIGVRKIDALRTLTTEALSVLMPFRSQEINHENGVFYGRNVISKNMIIVDRTQLLNGNSFILGISGSGKSFIAKSEIVATILKNKNADVIILDPDDEYSTLTKELGGEVINISATSNNHINALDLDENYGDGENPIILKSEFILSLCEQLIGEKNLGAIQKSIIDRCVSLVYRHYQQGNYKGLAPTLLDFKNELDKQPEPEAKEISLSLELFTTGSLNTFSKETNVNVNKNFICYNIKELGKQLRPLGMLVVLDNILNRISKNRKLGRATFLFVDEIYLMFKYEYSANFFYELWKRIRKYGGGATGITQNVEDVLQSSVARTMMSNSEFIVMLNQASTDRTELAKLLKISDLQLNYVTNVDAGKGLMKIGDTLVPFENDFPKNTLLYKLMTTKPNENKL